MSIRRFGWPGLICRPTTLSLPGYDVSASQASKYLRPSRRFCDGHLAIRSRNQRAKCANGLSPLSTSEIHAWPTCRVYRESMPIASCQLAWQLFDTQPFRHRLAEWGQAWLRRHLDRASVVLLCLPCENCIYKTLSRNPLHADCFVYTIIVEQVSSREITVIVVACQHESKKRHGKDRKGNQRFRCLMCGKTFVEETADVGRN